MSQENEQTKASESQEKSTSELTFTQMWQTLNHNQQRFAVAMLDSASKKEAAEAIGIEPNTAYGWNGVVDRVVSIMRTQAKDAAIAILTNSAVKAAMIDASLLDCYDPKIRQDAAEDILDRVLGRATQRLEHSGEDGAPIPVRITEVVVEKPRESVED